MPRRYVPWSEKVFYLEQSKREVQVEAKWHEVIFLGIEDESEIAVIGMPHGTVHSKKHSHSSKRGFWIWSAVQQHQRSPCELQPRAEGGVVNRVQLDVQAAIPEAPPPSR